MNDRSRSQVTCCPQRRPAASSTRVSPRGSPDAGCRLALVGHETYDTQVTASTHAQEDTMLLPRCCTPSARNFMRATRVNPVGRQWGTAAAAFSTSSLTLSAPIRVEGHPHLYLHPTSTKDRYALSFLSQPPLHPSSPTVLGIVSSTTVTPRTFEENPDWLQLLHEILSQTCWGDEALKTQAVNREEGYLHIIGGSCLCLCSLMPATIGLRIPDTRFFPAPLLVDLLREIVHESGHRWSQLPSSQQGRRARGHHCKRPLQGRKAGRRGVPTGAGV